jgi:hypothetical protein
MKHPQHDKLIAIANGEQMQSTQFRQGSYEGAIFKNCDPSTALDILSHESEQNFARLRIKPRTIMIGDMEVPEPMRVAPADGSECWAASPSMRKGYFKNLWEGDEDDLRFLQRGLLQATEQGAQQMLAALVKQVGGVL